MAIKVSGIANFNPSSFTVQPGETIKFGIKRPINIDHIVCF